jgi:hypothetical protein
MKAGVPSGHGTYCYPDGKVYVGAWDAGRPNGEDGELYKSPMRLKDCHSLEDIQKRFADHLRNCLVIVTEVSDFSALSEPMLAKKLGGLEAPAHVRPEAGIIRKRPRPEK